MRGKKAASLLAVLGLVSIMTFLAAAMTAMFMANLNLTQGSFNGDIALSQAEAGLHEVIYRLGSNEEYSFGQAGEELTGSMSSELTSEQSYYAVSFKPGGAFPHSTNNVKGDHAQGYGGRALAAGLIHVVSTGFCRGQYRTLEALVRQPDAPFGLASSAKIHSLYPLEIYGTSSTAKAADGTYDRPGHLLCNSSSGIQVEKGNAAPAFSTRISGFAQSCGPITLDPGARVDDGVRPNASARSIPKFDIVKDFDPQGKPGTIEIVELQHGAQELDCIYRSGHELTFNGPVKLYDAFLYVQGNLTVHGAISGTGAIVVNGDLNVVGSVELDGANNLALLSTGKVTLRGGSATYQSNYFQGYVYAENGVDAQNLTVVGSLIVNHPSHQPEPELKLDHVIVVNDDSQGKLTFTAQSYSYTSTQSASNNANWLSFDWVEWRKFHPQDPPGDPTGGLYENDILSKLPHILTHTSGSTVDEYVLNADGPSFLAASPPGSTPDISSVTTAFAAVEAQKVAAQEYQALLNLGPEPPGDDPAHQEWQAKQDRKNQLFTDLTNAWQAYLAAVEQFTEEYNNYVKQHSSGNGVRRLRPGAPPPDVKREYVFDLNKYLPISDRLQVTFWQVYGRRL
ncbi:MAG: hypothetical protein KF760_27715 [Candidatus Eremiobacteraeota bacterium]|nr:hypothetical protein [Candidatus Eremiobacteraeota bacterium]MCW5872553.1 hypothetical protein [Candidatus Eremiobacteraeota bacterium]